MKMMMNVHSGSVDTAENWEADSEQDGYGREPWDYAATVANGDLVEVVKDEDGKWVEKE